jgi:K+-sensing histidine kinase KdpD
VASITRISISKGVLPFIFQVKCEKLVVENADIAGGIVELVSMHRITKLVMGAAADKHYSRYEEMFHAFHPIPVGRT